MTGSPAPKKHRSLSYLSRGARGAVGLRVLRHIAGVCALVLVLGGGYLWSLFPQERGIERLPNLIRPVLVSRDGLGTPSISVSTEEDFFFALGYVHAQDRLWQMDLLRAAAWGELTSLTGERASALDLWHRRVGFYRQALALRANLPKAAHLLLQSYVNGINAYLTAHPTRLPPEFLLLRHRPAPWKMEDVLASGAMLMWLAVPCSSRVPSELDMEMFSVGDSMLSFRTLSQGLGLFLSDLSAYCRQSGDWIQYDMVWGSTIPSPWHEAALAIGSSEFRRGWAIPGWPVPFACVSSRQATFLITGQNVEPAWNVVTEWEEEHRVLEFIGDLEHIMYEDTVRIRDGWSVLAGCVPGGDSLGTRGAPGMDASLVERYLGLWIMGSRETGEDSLELRKGGPFRLITVGQAGDSVVFGGASEPPLAPGSVIMQSPFSFSLLRLLGRDRIVIKKAGYISDSDCAPWATGKVPVSAGVRWRPNRAEALLSTGESGIPGLPHYADQLVNWKTSTWYERSLTFPITKRCCVLIPLPE